MDRPNRPPDDIRVGPLEISGSRKVPERLVATDIRGFFFQTVHEYTKIEAYEESVFDRKVVETWNLPEGRVAMWRWLGQLTELERRGLEDLVLRGKVEVRA